MNAQYKKGVLELCVLALLTRKDRYGYDISEELSRRMDIADGTVYPLLRKLKTDGMVTTYLSEESGGPPRKYYALTSFGREHCKNETHAWLAFASTIEQILKGEES